MVLTVSKVKPKTRTKSWDYKFTEGCAIVFDEWHNRSAKFTVPEGRVVNHRFSNLQTADARIEYNRISRSGRTLTVPFWILEDKCARGLSWIEFTIHVDYEVTAPSRALNGAPSLQPQLRPEVDVLSSMWQDLSQVPSKTALLTNYPNPFNPETWIPYHLAEPADVTLDIYSADGKLVRTLALGHQSAGIYESKSRAAYWDGRNAVGERVASGVYFYTLTAGDFAGTGKMLIMK